VVSRPGDTDAFRSIGRTSFTTDAGDVRGRRGAFDLVTVR
jgi:hypothetical protein